MTAEQLNFTLILQNNPANQQSFIVILFKDLGEELNIEFISTNNRNSP